MTAVAIFWTALTTIVSFLLMVVFKAVASAVDALAGSLIPVLIVGAVMVIGMVIPYSIYDAVDGLTNGFTNTIYTDNVIGIISLIFMTTGEILVNFILIGLAAAFFGGIIFCICKVIYLVILLITNLFSNFFDDVFCMSLKALTNNLKKI